MVKTDKKKLDNFTVISWQDYQNLQNFSKVSLDRLRNALVQNGRVKQSESYICGMHAVNICFKLWQYPKQYTISTYPYTWIINPLVIIPLVNLFVKNPYIKWGLCSAQFAKKLIEPNFSFYSWICTNEMPWDLIDNTNYQTHSVIILIKCYNSALSVLHYMTIIGKSNDGKQYLLFDNSEKIYLASSTQLQRAMKIDTPTVNNYNAYRVG